MAYVSNNLFVGYVSNNLWMGYISNMLATNSSELYLVTKFVWSNFFCECISSFSDVLN